jgi:2'-5' RNA ligase
VTEPKIVGVVVDVPQPHASVLSAWRERVGDVQGRLIPPHVTLLPPTAIDPTAMEKIYLHLEQASSMLRPFAMHLSGTGTFRPLSQVVFVQVAAGIVHCEALATAIRSGPLDRELTYPYHPHVTVAQDVDDAALDLAYDGLSAFAARFVVTQFTVYEQRPDSRWTPTRAFPLGVP